MLAEVEISAIKPWKHAGISFLFSFSHGTLDDFVVFPFSLSSPSFNADATRPILLDVAVLGNEGI